jgi:hypothetical protein
LVSHRSRAAGYSVLAAATSVGSDQKPRARYRDAQHKAQDGKRGGGARPAVLRMKLLQLRRHYHLVAHNMGSKGKRWNRPKRCTSRKRINITRVFISVLAGLLATSGMAWAESCTVVQTGTLNLHGEPNGRIVGTLNIGTIVSMSSVITVQHHRWAKIVALQGKTGWVLRNYLLCEL